MAEQARSGELGGALAIVLLGAIAVEPNIDI